STDDNHVRRKGINSDYRDPYESNTCINSFRLRFDVHEPTNAFVLLGNLDYQTCRTNFQASVDALTAAAKEQNHQKTIDAYMKMTQNCFDSHKTFRREQFVNLA